MTCNFITRSMLHQMPRKETGDTAERGIGCGGSERATQTDIHTNVEFEIVAGKASQINIGWFMSPCVHAACRTCFVSRFLMQDASRKRLILREFLCWPSPSVSVGGIAAPEWPREQTESTELAGGTQNT